MAAQRVPAHGEAKEATGAMSLPDDWALVVGIAVTWAGLALLFLGFLAGAASARRGTRLRRLE